MPFVQRSNKESSTSSRVTPNICIAADAMVLTSPI
jgi:hypothetical protein